MCKIWWKNSVDDDFELEKRNKIFQSMLKIYAYKFRIVTVKKLALAVTSISGPVIEIIALQVFH